MEAWQKDFIALIVVILSVAAVVMVFTPYERTSNQVEPIITPDETPAPHFPETQKPSVCSNGETRAATCPDGVTTYLNENCVEGEWRQVMYIRNPCEPLSTPEPVKQEITSFEECISAGNPAMESYPRKCKDPVSGKTFIEEIDDVWRNDGIVLMQHEIEGYFACFGCSTPSEGPAMCIDPIPEMKQVDETEERYCNENFELVENG
jgi:hypothetical protein